MDYHIWPKWVKCFQKFCIYQRNLSKAHVNFKGTFISDENNPCGATTSQRAISNVQWNGCTESHLIDWTLSYQSLQYRSFRCLLTAFRGILILADSDDSWAGWGSTACLPLMLVNIMICSNRWYTTSQHYWLFAQDLCCCIGFGSHCPMNKTSPAQH